MKMNGIRHPLTGTPGRPDPVVGPAPAGQAQAAKPLAPEALPQPNLQRRPRRRGHLTLLGLAASAVVLGCASGPSTPWRIEPSYRVQGGGASATQGYLALAHQYEGEQRAALAIEAYRKAVQTAPDDADLHNLLGMALARQSQFGPAVLALRRAVALAPERAQLLNNLGYALLLDGRMEESRAIIRLTLALDPKHAQATRNLAYAEERLGATRLAAVPAAAVAPVVQAAVPAVAVAPVVLAAVPAAAVAPVVLAAVPAVAVAPVVLAAVPAVAVAPVVLAAVVPAVVTAAAPPVLATAAAAEPVVAPAAAATPVAALPPPASMDGVSVEVINGNGINGAASRLGGWLRERGIVVSRLANLLPYNTAQTQVLYQEGKAEQARSIALRLPVVAQVLPATPGSLRADLRVLLGRDVLYSAGCSELAVCATPERLTAAAAKPQ